MERRTWVRLVSALALFITCAAIYRVRVGTAALVVPRSEGEIEVDLGIQARGPRTQSVELSLHNNTSEPLEGIEASVSCPCLRVVRVPSLIGAGAVETLGTMFDIPAAATTAQVSVVVSSRSDPRWKRVFRIKVAFAGNTRVVPAGLTFSRGSRPQASFLVYGDAACSSEWTCAARDLHDAASAETRAVIAAWRGIAATQDDPVRGRLLVDIGQISSQLESIRDRGGTACLVLRDRSGNYEYVVPVDIIGTRTVSTRECRARLQTLLRTAKEER